MKNINQIADAIERDRREPDKIMLYVSDLRRVAYDLRLVYEWADEIEGNAQLRMIEAKELLKEISEGLLLNETT
jgi:hypothetical protein